MMQLKRITAFTLCTVLMVMALPFGYISYGESRPESLEERIQSAVATDETVDSDIWEYGAKEQDTAENGDVEKDSAETENNAQSGSENMGSDDPLGEASMDEETEEFLAAENPQSPEETLTDESLAGPEEADLSEEEVTCTNEEITYVNNENFPYVFQASEGGKFVLEEDIFWTRNVRDKDYAVLRTEEPARLDLENFSIHVEKESKLEISGQIKLYGRTNVFYVEGQLILKDGVSVTAEGDGLAVIYVDSRGRVLLNGAEIAATGDESLGIAVENGLLESGGAAVRVSGQNAIGIRCGNGQTLSGKLDVEVEGFRSVGVFMEADSCFYISGTVTAEGEQATGIYLEENVRQDPDVIQSKRKVYCYVAGDDAVGLYCTGDLEWSLLILWLSGAETCGVKAEGNVYLSYCDVWLIDVWKENENGRSVSAPGIIVFDTCSVVPGAAGATSYKRSAFPVFEDGDDTFSLTGFADYNLLKYGVWFEKGRVVEDIAFPDKLRFYMYDPNDSEKEMDTVVLPVEWDILNYDSQEYGPFEIIYKSEELLDRFNISGMNAGRVPLRFYDPDGLFLSHPSFMGDTSTFIYFLGDLTDCTDVHFWVSDDFGETWTDYLECETTIYWILEEWEGHQGFIHTDEVFDFGIEYYFMLEATRKEETLISEVMEFCIDHTDQKNIGGDRDGNDRGDQGEERTGGRRHKNNKEPQINAGQNEQQPEVNREPIDTDLESADLDLEESEYSALESTEEKLEAETAAFAAFMNGEDEEGANPTGSKEHENPQVASGRTGTENLQAASEQTDSQNLQSITAKANPEHSFIEINPGDNSNGMSSEWAEIAQTSDTLSLYRYGSAAVAVIVCGILTALYQRRKRV